MMGIRRVDGVPVASFPFSGGGQSGFAVLGPVFAELHSPPAERQ